MVSKKSASGIVGLDQILGGGLPQRRTTLLAGGPGCGKSLIGQSFIGHGATVENEPGIIITFEEYANEIVQNSDFLGYDFTNLIRSEKLLIEHIIPTEEIDAEETTLNLGGFLARIEYAVQQIGAKRILIDSIETLFSQCHFHKNLRGDLNRIIGRLKELGLTVVLTGEKGQASITKLGLEEYTSDCVIFLDHRVENQLSTRRLRVIKCRGSAHETDEFPFLIDSKVGVHVIPVTSLELNYQAKDVFISGGSQGLDQMLGGKGWYEGSTCLIAGTAGTGKTSFAGQFAQIHAAKYGRKVLFIAFEESSSQLIRNLKQVSIDLSPEATNGNIVFHCIRPSYCGLESHLSHLESIFLREKPEIVIMDPVTSLLSIGDSKQVYSILIRFLDTLKLNGVSVLITALLSRAQLTTGSGNIGISSIVDVWINLDYQIEANQRTRKLSVVKARGIPNSSEIVSFAISSQGIKIDHASGEHHG